MDDQTAWLEQIPKVRALLRAPVGEDEQGVRQECRLQVEQLADQLPSLVFEGRTDWPDMDDDWLLAALGRRLDDVQSTELLGLLMRGEDAQVLSYLVDQCLAAWRSPATPGDQPAPNDPGPVGENTAGWAASRTPGTYYYRYDGRDYLYADDPFAPAPQWQPLAVREQQAAERAQPWGDGWSTPAGAEELYGGRYVFALSQQRPWLTQADAEQRLRRTGRPTAWGPVWTVYDGATWRFALTESGPWTYIDGQAAVRDLALVEEATARLMHSYPHADIADVRKMTAQYVAETARTKG